MSPGQPGPGKSEKLPPENTKKNQGFSFEPDHCVAERNSLKGVGLTRRLGGAILKCERHNLLQGRSIWTEKASQYSKYILHCQQLGAMQQESFHMNPKYHSLQRTSGLPHKTWIYGIWDKAK